jgi:hypothetical protein
MGKQKKDPPPRKDIRIGRGFKRRNLGPGDIPKHKCTPEVEGSTMGGGKKTTRYRCSTCHVSMGSKTEDL